MGIEQECAQLQSMLGQVFNSLAEVQSRAKGLPDCDIHELNREITEILEVCYYGLSSLQASLNHIELIQRIIGNQTGGFPFSPYQTGSVQPSSKSGFIKPISPSAVQPTSPIVSFRNLQQPSMSNHTSGNVPSGVDVNNLSEITPQQRLHILDGDATGGGHGAGRGISGKSEFPSRWSDEETIDYISDIVRDSNSKWIQQTGKPGAKYTLTGKPVKWQIEATRDGVDIKIIVEPDGRGIITAFPTNIPPNP